MYQFTLKCGDWKVMVDNRLGYYSGFINALKEKGALPNIIDVPSIVKDQWNAWMRLKDWIEGGLGCFLEHQSNRRTEYDVLMNSCYLRKQARNNALVLLSEVEDIVSILLSLPPEWRMYVVCDSDIPYSRRLEHYQLTGSIVDNLQSHYTWKSCKFLDVNFTLSSEEGDWANQYRGCFHSGVIKHLLFNYTESGYKCQIDWDCLPWNDIVSIDSPGGKVIGSEELLCILAGRPNDMLKEEVKLFPSRYARLLPHREEFYDRFIQVYSNTNPVAWGLNYILSDDVASKRGDSCTEDVYCSTYLAYIHKSIIHEAKVIYPMNVVDDEDKMEHIVICMAERLGTVAMKKLADVASTISGERASWFINRVGRLDEDFPRLSQRID
jgi:hypothetical protein